MAVYKPRRKGKETGVYLYDFWFHGARFQGSTGTYDRELAEFVEARYRFSLEFPLAGIEVFVVDDWFPLSGPTGHSEVVQGYGELTAALQRSKNRLAAQLKEEEKVKEDLKPWKDGKRLMGQVKKLLKKPKPQPA